MLAKWGLNKYIYIFGHILYIIIYKAGLQNFIFLDTVNFFIFLFFLCHPG